MTQYTKKLNEQGEYLPFYGYTSVSMLEAEKKNTIALDIENFIKKSSICKYYSPLPHDTYHMTLFNIYSMASKPIPSVQRWIDVEGGTIPKTVWLSEDVLKIQHIRASDALRKLPRKLKISDLKFYYKKGGLGVWVTLDKECEEAVVNLRKELAMIYEHEDEKLKLHVTFAYLFKPLPFNNPDLKKEEIELKRDLSKLNKMLNSLTQCFLYSHNIYLYNSMTNYLPLDFFYSSNVPD
jgi:Domain of unknown function (DUF1868)